MEKLTGKLKVSISISLIIIVLSITWLILDYYVLSGILTNSTLLSNFEVLILKISIGVFALLIISFLIIIYYALRVSAKAKSELNKAKKENEKKEDIVLPTVTEPDK